MAFRFTKATAVAVGTFNIYIVQPHWLAGIGLVEEGAPIRMEADFTRPGFRFGADGAPVKWNVRPDCLIIETDSSSVDCGAPLAAVLKTLQWTPLMGVGTNMVFEADREVANRLRYKLPDCDAPDGFQEGQSSWHLALIRKPQVFNFQIITLPDNPQKVSLSINVHTDVSKIDKQVEANSLAQAACSQFTQHCDDALRLARQVLNAEISL